MLKKLLKLKKRISGFKVKQETIGFEPMFIELKAILLDLTLRKLLQIPLKFHEIKIQAKQFYSKNLKTS